MSPLVFLLGNHRSGTTWLYQLLADTGRFSVLRARHVIEWERYAAAADGKGPPPDPAELAARMAGLGDRLGEGVTLSPDLPEEYGYILNNHGRRTWLVEADVPLFSRIRRVLDDGRPVLLKNPWDYGHFPYLAARFPDARFVFVHRHPVPVVHSAVALFRAMWSRREPYLELLSRRYRRLWANPVSRATFRFLAAGAVDLDVRATAAGVVAANRHYAARIASVDPPRRIELRYEDLCDDPGRELARILAFLGEPPMTHDVSPRPRGAALLPAVARRGPHLCAAMPAYLARLGYDEAGAIPWTPP